MKQQIMFWFCTWAALADALVGILTFGFVVTSFDNKLANWAVSKGIINLPNCQNSCGNCTCDED